MKPMRHFTLAIALGLYLSPWFLIAANPPVDPPPIPSDDPGPGFGDRAIPPHAPAQVVAPSEPGAPAFTTVPGSWVAQGPGPISGGQVEGITNGYVCGAIHAVAAHPTDPNTVYIGAVNGGVWKTTNATAASPTWTTTTSGEASLAIGALAFDPLDVTSNTLWAGHGRFSSFSRNGGSRSGLLKTTDGGATWQSVTGGGTLVGKNISGIVARGDTILVSINTSDSGLASQNGVWRSTNGGASFTQMAVGNGSVTGLPEGVAYDIVSSSVAPNTVFTCIALPTTAAAKGIFKSSDLGATWSRVSTPVMESFITTSTSNIELAVGNAGNVFVGILESGALVGVFSSPNSGATWSRMDIPTMPLVAATTFTLTDATNASPIVVTTSAAHGYATNSYVEVSGVAGNTAANGVFQITVLTSTAFALDFSIGNGPYGGGGTAERVITPNPRGSKGPDAETGTPDEIAGGQGSIHFSILADPANPNLVYLGGDRQDLPFPNYIGAVNYSGNLWRGDTSLAPNGASPSSQWKHLTHSNAVAGIPGGGTTTNSSPHADSRDMAIDAAGNLIEVDDGGVFRRTSPQSNAGAWISMAGNLQVTEAHNVAYDTVSNIIITGNQDNGTSEQVTSGSTDYRAVSTADGGDVAVSVNPSNASQSIRYSSFQNLAAGSFRKRILSNTNSVVSQTFPALTPLGGAPALVGQFTTPVVINSINANRLIIGASNGVYESTDQGATVSRVSTLSPNDGGFGGLTMVYGGRQGGVDNAEVIYFVDSASIFRRTTAGGALNAVAGYSGSTVRGIITDPSDYDHVIAIDNNQVFRSTNGGATFTDITGDIPAAVRDFRCLAYIGSGGAGAIVVGTLRGVYAARATAVTDWAPVGTDLPNAYVWDLAYDAADDVLIAGTLGRGAWRFNSVSSMLPPAVSVLARAGASPTNVSPVMWTLTFSSAVTGISAANFSVAGVPASVGAPTTVDGGVNWTVPVTHGPGDGTLTLSLANSTGHDPIVSTPLPFAGQSYTIDTVTQTPTLTAPATNATVGNPITVSFSLPEAAQNGSVQVAFSGGASRTLTLANSQGTAGAHSFNFDPASPVGGAVAGISGGSSIPDGTYTVALSYQDALGNAAASATSTNVTINTNTPPSGGSFTVTPSSGVKQTDPLVLSAPGWTDPNTPLTYQFFNGVTALNSPDASSSLNIAAPAAGGYTFKVRVTDSLGAFTDSTQPLTVVPFNSIESWRLSNFGSYDATGNRADTADFDLDGRLNLEEFAFGTDPTTGASGPQALVFNGTFASGSFGSSGQPIIRFEPVATGIDFRLLFCRRVDHVAAGLTYFPEFSADMNTWAPGAIPTVLATNIAGTIQIVSVPYLTFIGGKKARYAHVRVTILP